MPLYGIKMLCIYIPMCLSNKNDIFLCFWWHQKVDCSCGIHKREYKRGKNEQSIKNYVSINKVAKSMSKNYDIHLGYQKENNFKAKEKKL